MPEDDDTDTAKPARLFYIDNLRWLVIAFVVLVHTAVTYSGLGSWYYIEPFKLDLPSFAFFGVFLSFTQAYFMGLLFLIAGYFVPGAFDRKGFSRFLGDRAIRLGVPTLFYMIFVNTAIIYYLMAFLREEPHLPVGQAFLDYILSFKFLSGSGPMWFAFALLIFSAAYAAARLLRYRLGSRREEVFPGRRAMAGLIFLIAVCAFLLRLVQPIGTSVMNMQLCFFSQYVLLFTAGIIAYRRNLLALIPYPFGMAWFKAALIGGSAFWLAIMVLGGGFLGDLSPYSGGFHWQSAAYALWESFFCVGTILGLLVLFREHYDHQGRFERFMSENSFSVYVFHAPILIAVTLAMRGLAWHPLLKFAVAGAVAVPLCFAASHLILRRIPLLKKVL